MMNSHERTCTVFNGGVPDRPPLFDLLPNDAVITHFAGRRADGPERASIVYQAYAAGAVDATRSIGIPHDEGEEVWPNGQKVYWQRWTAWVEPMPLLSVEDAAAKMRAEVEAPPLSDAEIAAGARGFEADYLALSAQIAPCALVGNYYRKVGLMALYGGYGWENFAALLADEPELVDAFMERTTCESLRAIDAMHPPAGMPAAFLAEDFASGTGTMVSPAFLRKAFFPRIERLVDAYHRKGIKVLFHSDGDLQPVLDDLVACGIDGLNPIDIASGMRPAEIRQRHPKLVLVGGIDCARLLPFGTPDDVRKATRQLIEDAGPALLVGSSSETGDDVPLENFLAMAEVVRNWEY